MAHKLKPTELKRMDGVHPKLCELIIRTAALPTAQPFMITDGFRTQEQQAALYAKGRTTTGPIVTWTMQSKHLKQADGYGHAFDFCPLIGDKLIYNPALNLEPEIIELSFYTLIGILQNTAKEIGIKIRSGSDWDTNGIIDGKELSNYRKKWGKLPKADLPHIELVT